MNQTTYVKQPPCFWNKYLINLLCLQLDRVLVHRLACREVERAQRWLATNVEASMDPNDLLNSALERFAKLDDRVKRTMSYWHDLPPTLRLTLPPSLYARVYSCLYVV